MAKLLSKSRFLEGRQCLKRVYLSAHRPDLATPPDAALQALFRQGTAIGELARTRWPHGVLINIPHSRHGAAVARTRQLLADPSVPAIFEAGFTELGVRMRADILSRTSDGRAWDLIEVKASTGAKPVHDADIAVQAAVIEAAGIPLQRKSLMAIDMDYIYEGGDIDVGRLFTLIDRTASVDEMQCEVHRLLDEMHRAVEKPTAPKIDPSKHCSEPYNCPFWDHCTADKPEHWVFQLPGLRRERFAELQDEGIDEIARIPEGFPLTKQQARVRASVKSGRPWVSPDLGAALATVASPLFFLDFETFNPALPVYPGTHPYQRIPFQWSCHIDRGRGELEHEGFLAKNGSDPRRPLAESLIGVLEDTGSVVVYSSFEQGVLADLATEFPDLSKDLKAIAGRLWDLLEVIRDGYYHPQFHGSLSIKSVLPVIAPELAYDDLEIRDGGTASLRFQEMATGTSTGARARRLAKALKDYGTRDTLALAKIMERLRAVA